MTELDVWPTRAQFRPGEPVRLQVRLTGGTAGARLPLRVRVLSLGEPVAEVADRIDVAVDGFGQALPSITLGPGIDPGDRSLGYAVEVSVDLAGGPGGDPLRATTAFDVARHWSAAPRYGFFADFPPEQQPHESQQAARCLLTLHLNVVQFYDWMATHHTFFPAGAEEFTDPLGRQVSHRVVRRKVELAHEAGAAALAYGALYGAEADFSDAHPSWLLHDGDGQPLSLAGRFYLQDFGEASPWRSWIIGQYRQALTRIGFDGIHIDQYGFPKRARSRASGAWQEVDLADQIPGFVQEVAEQLRSLRPTGGSVFNCVNAWPVSELSPVTADAATYIEVWEPHTTYRDLYELVRHARTLRPDKAVILAAYLPPFGGSDHPRPAGALHAFRLATAAIHASGGFHLIAGEGGGLLADPYYPRYGRLDRHEFDRVRAYFDFVVRNTELLHASGPDIAWTHVGPTNEVITLDHPDLTGYGAGAHPDTLWVLGRADHELTSLQLVNLRGLDSGRWDASQPAPPRTLSDLAVHVRVTGEIAGVWWDTPDDDVGYPRPLPFEVVSGRGGRSLVFRVPRVAFWSSVWWRGAGADA